MTKEQIQAEAERRYPDKTTAGWKDGSYYVQREAFIEACEWMQSQQPDVSGSLPAEIYVTYDTHDGEVLCAFVDKEQCKREAEECGCGMQTVRLVSNDR